MVVLKTKRKQKNDSSKKLLSFDCNTYVVLGICVIFYCNRWTESVVCNQ